MSEDAGHGGWRRAVESRVTRLQQQDGRLRRLALLWVATVSVALLTCAVFFVVIFWIFG